MAAEVPPSRRAGALGPRPAVTALEFEALSRFVYEVSGIHLGPGKEYLVETRLGGLLVELGCASYSELLYRVKTDRSKRLAHLLVDAISTNETLFFRDRGPFELLREKLLPEILERRRALAPPGIAPVVRIWSAACSTGQEAYSAAVAAQEALGRNPGASLRILGTDISGAAVARAIEGRYSDLEVERGLPPELRDRYFRPAEGASWQVRDEIRAPCSFRQLNLLEPFGFLGRFDVVLCRNVAIYFRAEDRRRLFERLADSIEPGGALLIGASEFLTGVTERFVARRHREAVYYEPAGG